MSNTRRCMVCGKKFMNKKGRNSKYPVCSKDCKKILSNFNSKVSNDVGYDTKRMKQPPTLTDKMYVISVLSDFGITVNELPLVSTTSALYRWKNSQIKKVLNK